MRSSLVTFKRVLDIIQPLLQLLGTFPIHADVIVHTTLPPCLPLPLLVPRLPLIRQLPTSFLPYRFTPSTASIRLHPHAHHLHAVPVPLDNVFKHQVAVPVKGCQATDERPPNAASMARNYPHLRSILLKGFQHA